MTSDRKVKDGIVGLSVIQTIASRKSQTQKFSEVLSLVIRLCIQAIE